MKDYASPWTAAISPMASLFSIAFMFIPIYLRLEGNVPPPIK